MFRKNKKLFLMLIIIFALNCIFKTAFANNAVLTNSINAMIMKNQKSTNISNTENINRFALILFYLHSCPHCKRFDPVLRQFSEEHKIPVLAYTLDGQSLPSFPNSITPDNSEVLKFFPTQSPVVPTLFLMDEKTHRIYPVLQGEASEEQLSQRLLQLTSKISEENI